MVSPQPRLAIRTFVIEMFRTFRDPTSIPLVNESGSIDRLAVFHGRNASGKSNALAALDMFFRGSAVWLASGANPANREPSMREDDIPPRLRLPWGWRDDATGFELSHRSFPPGYRDMQSVAVVFADPALEMLSFSLTPAGNEVYLDFNRHIHTAEGFVLNATRGTPAARAGFARISTALLTPYGPGSTPFFRLGARRAHGCTIGGGLESAEANDIPLTMPIASRLYEFATSIEAPDRERWRAFVALISRFKTLSQHELSIVQIPSAPHRVGLFVDLRFEIRGKQVLRLSELSSGEQQVVALCAAALASRAAIVAIEEPEISLHSDYQVLLRDVLLEHLDRGIIDQILLESHSPQFDGPEVVQFTRSDDEPPITRVERQRSADGDPAVRDRARAAGAKRHWVSKDGYTQLPPELCKRFQIGEQGGYVWFLPASDGSVAWQAWREEDLDAVFGDRTGEPSE